MSIFFLPVGPRISLVVTLSHQSKCHHNVVTSTTLQFWAETDFLNFYIYSSKLMLVGA